MVRKHDRYRIAGFVPYLVRPTLPRKLIAVLPENLLRLPHSRAFADGLAKTQKNKRRVVFPPRPQLLEPCRQLQMFHPARLSRVGVGVLRYVIAMGYRVIKRHKTKITCVFHIRYLPKNHIVKNRKPRYAAFGFSNIRIFYQNPASDQLPPVRRHTKSIIMNSAVLTGLMPIATLSSLRSIVVSSLRTSSQRIL